MSDLIERLKKLTSNLGRDYSSGEQFVRNGTSQDVVDALFQSIAALSEAEQREKDARRVALGEAAEAIFVMGAWSPHYEKLTPNTFDEGTSAAYEIIRELQGKAEIASLSRAAP